jgi:hypothetical protein
LEALREIGRIETGTVAEQDVQLSTGLRLRRLQIRLDRPTRNGENTLALLTTVPVEVATALTLAALYRERWTLEKAFLHLTLELRC